MKWFKVDYDDVFFNGLTTNQIGILVKYRCHCQQYEVDQLSEKQINSCFTWKERQFLVKYLIEKGELSDNFRITLEQNRTETGQEQDNFGVKQDNFGVKQDNFGVKQDKNRNFLSSKNKEITNPYNTDKRDKRDKREERDKIDNSDKSPSKKYAFEGKIIKLTQEDFDRWQRAYPDLNLYAELLQRDTFLVTQPPDEQKRWYMSTSAFFIKQNERRKTQSISNDNVEEIWGNYL